MHGLDRMPRVGSGNFGGVGLDLLGADSLFQSEGLGPIDGLGGLGLAPAMGGSMPMGPFGFGGSGAAASMGQARKRHKITKVSVPK